MKHSKQLDVDAILESFDHSDETRTFEEGIFQLVKLGEMTIGKATYQPGWKWSEHVAPLAQKPFCDVEHTGKVLEKARCGSIAREEHAG